MQGNPIDDRTRKAAAIARLYLSQAMPVTDWSQYTDEQVCEIAMKVLKS